jgi:general secretion pathway protein F
MPSFEWSALNPSGEKSRGVVEAANRTAVVDRLQRQGQIVLRAEPTDSRSKFADLLRLDLGAKRGLDRTAVSEFTREVAIMLGAGQDLDRTLRFVVDNVGNSRTRNVLAEVRDRVRSGISLADAL